MDKVLRKNPQLTSVLVEQTPVQGWSIGDARVARAAHLDVKVTSGTNTAEEKARFVARAHALMTQILGTLPDATYVVVHEIAADAWGYGGETQAQRALRAKAA
jgi:4-oxalocrotonate tautomerase